MSPSPRQCVQCGHLAVGELEFKTLEPNPGKPPIRLVTTKDKVTGDKSAMGSLALEATSGLDLSRIVNLNLAVQNQTNPAKRFLTVPWALAFAMRSCLRRRIGNMTTATPICAIA